MQETLKLFALHWGVIFLAMMVVTGIYNIGKTTIIYNIGKTTIWYEDFPGCLMVATFISLATFAIHWGLT